MSGSRSGVLRRVIVAAALLVLVAGCSASDPPPRAVAVPPATGATAPRTVVSLTFDDGSRTQYLVRPILLDHGMRATFYIVSGFVDRPDGSSMTWDQIRGLAADGHDIGGHTRTHQVLPTLTPAAQLREVCDDRDRLVALGFRPVSFAYPTGLFDASSAAAVRRCGYRTGRTAGDVSEFGPNYAARMPPADPYATAALATPPTGPLTAEYLQTAVRAAAAHGGGWVPIVLHQVCRPSAVDYATCMRSEGPVDLGVFRDFVDWLAHDAPDGTVVQPVSAVVGAD